MPIELYHFEGKITNQQLQENCFPSTAEIIKCCNVWMDRIDNEDKKGTRVFVKIPPIVLHEIEGHVTDPEARYRIGLLSMVNKLSNASDRSSRWFEHVCIETLINRMWPYLLKFGKLSSLGKAISILKVRNVLISSSGSLIYLPVF